MQNAAFRKLKLNSVYVAFRLKGIHLEEALNGVRSLGIAGLNVTVPHKSAVIPYLDDVTPLALRVGAVNTIVNREGRLIGTNTDAAGFLRSLKEAEFSPAGKSVVLLGAGGSARSLLAGLSEAGVQRIGIWNRTRVRAERLLEEFKEGCRETELEVLQDDKLDGLSCDLLINSTSAGMKEGEISYDLNQAGSISRVSDIIYNPPRTPLLRQAEAMGIPNQNGIGMLLHQGCEAFRFWTGHKAPVDVMREELLSQLNL